MTQLPHCDAHNGLPSTPALRRATRIAHARSWLSALIVALCAFGAAQTTLADTLILKDDAQLPGKSVHEQVGGELVWQLPDGSQRRFERAEIQAVATADPDGIYVRLVRYRPGWSQFEVASKTFVHPETHRRITLVGAVHIADLSYFHELQKSLDAHDAVLFEGVGADSSKDLSTVSLPDAETRAQDLARKKRRSSPPQLGTSLLDPITGLQMSMARFLDLRFQKDGIDYRRSWWWPADVSSDELLALLGEQDFGLSNLVRSSFNVELQAQSEQLMADTLKGLVSTIFTGKPTQVVFKETFAELLAVQMGQLLTPPQCDASGKPIVSPFDGAIVLGRNKVAVAKIDQILQVDGVGSVALFYGAAHLPDIARTLIKRGYERESTTWYSAWRMHWDHKPFWQR